jgi:hypothetical protein
MPAMRVSRRVLISGGIALAIVAGLVVSSAFRGRSPAELEIENAFTRAIETEQSVDVPLVGKAGDEPTDEQLDRQAAQGAAAVRAIFADAAAEQVLKGLDNLITSQRQSRATLRILGAGVDYVNVHDITITGTTATATGRAKVWMRTQVKQRPGDPWGVVDPHNELDYTMHFARDTGGPWIVQVYGWSFVGGGP